MWRKTCPNATLPITNHILASLGSNPGVHDERSAINRLSNGPAALTFSGKCMKTDLIFSVDKKNELDVTFCVLYFSSNSCLTCFGQPCAHHQELTTA